MTINANKTQIKELHLLDYLNLIRKRKWVLIACVIIGLITAMIIAHFKIPIYQATCQIIIDKDINRSLVTGENIEYLSYDTAYTEGLDFNTHLKIITSFQVLEDVIDKLDLKNLYKDKEEDQSFEKRGFFSNIKTSIAENIMNIKALLIDRGNKKTDKKEKNPKNLIKALPDQETAQLVSVLRKRIRINPVHDTRLVNIVAYDENPVWAATIANSIATTYIEYDDSIKNKSVKGFLNWVSDQIDEMKSKIDESEKRFFDFKTENKMSSIQEKQNINTQKIAELNGSYIQIRTQMMDLEAKTLQLENLINTNQVKTTDYVNIPDAMFAIEENLIEKIKNMDKNNGR